MMNLFLCGALNTRTGGSGGDGVGVGQADGTGRCGVGGLRGRGRGLSAAVINVLAMESSSSSSDDDSLEIEDDDDDGEEEESTFCSSTTDGGSFNTLSSQPKDFNGDSKQFDKIMLHGTASTWSGDSSADEDEKTFATFNNMDGGSVNVLGDFSPLTEPQRKLKERIRQNFGADIANDFEMALRLMVRQEQKDEQKEGVRTLKKNNDVSCNDDGWQVKASRDDSGRNAKSANKTRRNSVTEELLRTNELPPPTHDKNNTNLLGDNVRSSRRGRSPSISLEDLGLDGKMLQYYLAPSPADKEQDQPLQNREK